MFTDKFKQFFHPLAGWFDESAICDGECYSCTRESAALILPTNRNVRGYITDRDEFISLYQNCPAEKMLIIAPLIDFDLELIFIIRSINPSSCFISYHPGWFPCKAPSWDKTMLLIIYLREYSIPMDLRFLRRKQ